MNQAKGRAMRTVFRVVLFFMLAPGMLIAGEVYRWVDGHGRTHYTDTPPPASADYQELDMGACETQDCLRRRARDHAAALQRQQEIHDWLAARAASGESYRFDVLANDGTVVVRMKKRHVLQAWGAPERLSRSISTAGSRESWSYPDRHATVYFGPDGLVDRIRN
jgi:hypothetical protein